MADEIHGELFVMFIQRKLLAAAAARNNGGRVIPFYNPAAGLFIAGQTRKGHRLF